MAILSLTLLFLSALAAQGQQLQERQDSVTEVTATLIVITSASTSTTAESESATTPAATDAQISRLVGIGCTDLEDDATVSMYISCTSSVSSEIDASCNTESTDCDCLHIQSPLVACIGDVCPPEPAALLTDDLESCSGASKTSTGPSTSKTLSNLDSDPSTTEVPTDATTATEDDVETDTSEDFGVMATPALGAAVVGAVGVGVVGALIIGNEKAGAYAEPQVSEGYVNMVSNEGDRKSCIHALPLYILVFHNLDICRFSSSSISQIPTNCWRRRILRMATVAPPPAKRQRREDAERAAIQQDVTAVAPSEEGTFRARFIDNDGNQMADVIEIPLADASEKNVSQLLNTLLGREQHDNLPYRFRIHVPGTDTIIDAWPRGGGAPQTGAAGLGALLRSHGVDNPDEMTITLSAEPQAVFKVQAVTRMAARIPGHGENILCAQFSPKSSSRLATGSGDCTARIWDTDTGTPKTTLKGHRSWVLVVAWSPDGERLATGGNDKEVRVWDPEKGKQVGAAWAGHRDFITSLAWEPYHLWDRESGGRLASASKDSTVRVWRANTGRTEHVLSGHKGKVTCVRWGGTGMVYTASNDKTIRVWRASDGTLAHTLASHAHWVNHLALSTEFVLRTGFFDKEMGPVPDTPEGKRERAKQRFEKAAVVQGKAAERLVSGSEDFTMYLWDPSQSNKPIARMHGHQKQVNHVTFSPDGTLIASAAWDNHTKIWSGKDGRFINTLRGHVAPVFQAAFSADSRLLVTGSRDTTLKVWDMRTCKLSVDLPGHQDQVFAVDWAPDGKMVGSGGADKAVRLWRN
ncbi:hypothetical protein MKZ38_002519 [Zalerion maritima]|uniref:Uncharacterized protein n=1 Tax=Zalerion maritima TaxID=339359 RepID=A0AAD5WR85_9PEZI|nr:hypothetical protein MKZ38_002519 [Zalerion maritima]